MSDSASFETVDPTALPKHFDAPAAEARWGAVWESSAIYRWDSERPREETFVIDTPPPTVSGRLHVGHVFSYTHTDILARQRRMRGMNVFYPMGWDDNGLPTERRVQNLYHVRCEPGVPYDPDLALEPVDPKEAKKTRPRLVGRQNFIELCERVTHEDEAAFEALYRRMGLSVDWTQKYATIDRKSRTLAQLSFLDLHAKGHLYSLEAPTMWDVDFQTAVAQAELEDRPKKGAFHDIEFAVEGGGSFVISTTRPELLPACVAVTAHPDDERYRPLFGKRAITPLFGAPVPIFPSDVADPEKGTGILMVCTFGDQTDVEWWKEEKLDLKEIVGKDGRLLPVTFGEGVFASTDPARANRYYGDLVGKKVAGARQVIVEQLRDPAGSATGSGAPLQGEPVPTDQAVKYYEKGDRPLEFVTTRQWFAKLLEQKAELLAKGEEVTWHPAYMGTRYRNWTEGLRFDWCVSRQRYFGVPIPVWYRVADDGRTLWDEVILPSAAQLPVDPTADAPEGFAESQRGQPGGFVGEQDVFDTWFTSSLTPQLSSHWLLDDERHGKLFPADMRPQAHEIIRTWAFYTIAKAMLHEASVPWHHVVISGWVVDKRRKKISKTKGNAAETPMDLLDAHTTDGVRYWSGGARLGTDTAYDEKVFKVGKRLVTKLYNAGKFVLSQEAEVHPITAELDRAFVAELKALVDRATAAYDEFEFGKALAETESFFWGRFTDSFLELTKGRARGDVGDAAARGSAVAALRFGLNVLLRLFAPTLPYITEEVWSWVFARESGHPSIHAAPWPSAEDFAGVLGPADAASFQRAVDAMAVLYKTKSDEGASAGRVVEDLVVAAHPSHADALAPVWDDVAASARCQAHRFETDAGVEAGVLEVRSIRLQPKPPKKA
jgi:valyl-tRNA synthetase